MAKKNVPQHKAKRIRVAFTIVNPSGKPIPVASAAKYIQLPTMTANITANSAPAPSRDADDDDDDIDF